MSTCDGGNGYTGDNMGVRISSVFVMMVGSWAGAWFPVFARRHQGMGVPESAFFVAKYFGSGVIIGTAFIHLLAPANRAWSNPCLAGVIPDYPWAEGIALMTVFLLFILELVAMRYTNFDIDEDDVNPKEKRRPSAYPMNLSVPPGEKQMSFDVDMNRTESGMSTAAGVVETTSDTNHFAHSQQHTDNADIGPDWQEHGLVPETYSAQLTAVFILEFGVIFHSVFVGLTLAVAGKEFNTLYIVLTFHQTFEGLGLGSRLATIPWPRSKRWTPYILASAFGITTPIAIAIGLTVRTSWQPESSTALITNGTFDAISAGILIYTGLIELMAHEFMFSNEMRQASIKVVLAALGTMVFGAGIMALLGHWV